MHLAAVDERIDVAKRPRAVELFGQLLNTEMSRFAELQHRLQLGAIGYRVLGEPAQEFGVVEIRTHKKFGGAHDPVGDLMCGEQRAQAFGAFADPELNCFVMSFALPELIPVSCSDQNVRYVLVRFTTKLEGQPTRLFLEFDTIAGVEQDERQLFFSCFTVCFEFAVAIARNDVPTARTGTRNNFSYSGRPGFRPLNL